MVYSLIYNDEFSSVFINSILNIFCLPWQVIRELDSGDQLENVNKLKIVQYQYKPEYLNQNRTIEPEDDKGK